MVKTPVPPYCECTPEQFAAAKAEHEKQRQNPCFFQVAGFRRSTLAAQMNSGMPIEPKLAIEFKDVIEARAYRPVRIDQAANIAQAKREREARDKFLAAQAEAAKKPRRLTLRQASELLNAIDYDAWCKSDDGVQAVKDGWI